MDLKMRESLPEYQDEGPFLNTMNWLTDLFQKELRFFEGEYTLVIKRDNGD